MSTINYSLIFIQKITIYLKQKSTRIDKQHAWTKYTAG